MCLIVVSLQFPLPIAYFLSYAENLRFGNGNMSGKPYVLDKRRPENAEEILKKDLKKEEKS